MIGSVCCSVRALYNSAIRSFHRAFMTMAERIFLQRITVSNVVDDSEQPRLRDNHGLESERQRTDLHAAALAQT
ncbi:hypothetical protein WJ968_12375 [Achromobacter xylosoxidans]